MLWYQYTSIQTFPMGVTQYFPDMAIRLLHVFLTKIQCPHIVSYVTKTIEHCVLALWSILDKVKFKLHMTRWILFSWFEEGLLVGLGDRDGTEAWISAGSSTLGTHSSTSFRLRDGRSCHFSLSLLLDIHHLFFLWNTEEKSYGFSIDTEKRVWLTRSN